MNNMKKLAKELYKKYKGQLGIFEVVAEIGSRGYNVIFFNTPEGDKILKAYGLECVNAKAFTYCGVSKIVFVDNNLSQDRKFYALLHELGHIAMEHFGDNIIELTEPRLLDIEADAFAYSILHPPKSNKARVLTTACAFTLTLFLGAAAGYTAPRTLSSKI